MQTDRPRPSETRLDADHRDRPAPEREREERDARANIDLWLEGADSFVGFEGYTRFGEP